MDDDGVDRFDMDEDYVDPLLAARRPQSRDDLIYGIFAAGSSDSESESGRRSRKRRRNGGDAKPDLSKPVQFVSTGSFMPGKVTEEPASPSAGDRPGIGLGFRPPAASAVEETEDDLSFLPTAFGKTVQEGAKQRKKEREKEKEKERERSSTSSRRGAAAGTPEVGSFESHTTGFGSKILKKFGYTEGSGLGKNAQGIVAPIEVKLRPKTMGMGFNDYKEAKLPALDPAAAAPTTTQAKAVPVTGQKLWSKRQQGRKKAEILTPAELLASKEDHARGSDTVQKVIDMRGPQVRVLASLENLNTEREMEAGDVPMPELQFNVRLIVDTTEVDIQRLDRDLRREREKVASLVHEKERIERDEARQREQLRSLEMIADIIETVKADDAAGILTVDTLLKTFGDVKSRFSEEYKLCNLSAIACAHAYPLMLRVFQGWDPLRSPSHGLQLMSAWRDLLQGDQPFDYSDDGAALPYAQLVGEVILPAVRISGTNTWLARDPEPMLRFLESWDVLLPPPILQSILEQIVIPKLSAAVDSWDPRRETVPIHVWIHPWLPLLGSRLEMLYHTIRFKLSSVLGAWHPSDSSAYAILSPWKDVFDPVSWEDLIVRHILPKLQMALREFQVNPANQKLDQFKWVMAWASVVPAHHMVGILEVEFFTKWHQVLYHWLASTKPDFTEITHWYYGWKGLFPPELLAHERIKMLLAAGLEMMNQAAEGMEVVQPGTRENIGYLRATERRQFESTATAATGQVKTTDLSLKELIQEYAMDQGVLFMPRVGKFYNGLQVFDFGSVSVCLDPVKRLIYAPQGQEGTDGWTPVGLAQLMEMNRNATRLR